MEAQELTVKLTIDATEALETLGKIKAELKEIAELKGQVSERQIVCHINFSSNTDVDKISEIFAENIRNCLQAF